MSEINDLVTIGIITYNQANTIVELLDSIYQQTYKNIEVIVSDDCSKDNTVEIVQNWFVCHSDRFVRTEIICSNCNKGISANRNKGLMAAKGKWFKPTDGDDVLLPTCIENFMNYYESHPDAVIMVGKMICFGANQEHIDAMYKYFDSKYYKLNTEEQLDLLIFGSHNFIGNPASMYNLEQIKGAGIRYDERIPMLDDFPFWINALKRGFKIDFIDKDVTKYRGGGQSNQSRESLRCYESGRLFRFYYQYPEWQKSDNEDAVKTVVKEECQIYSELLRLENTKAYKIGKAILYPINIMKKIICNDKCTKSNK